MKLNKKQTILSLSLFLFLSLSCLSSAQIMGINYGEVAVRSVIAESIIIPDTETNPVNQLLKSSIQKVIATNYDNRPIQDIQMVLASDPAAKEEFIKRLMVEFAPAVLQTLEQERQNVSQNNSNNTSDPKNDPTKADFQIVQPECIGDQSNNNRVQGMSVKDSGYCGWRDLIALINRIIKFCVYIAAALSAVAFAYAGFLYMTAFGSSGKIEEAHGIFKKTFTGILFVLMGWLLVYTLLQVLGTPATFSILKQP